MELFGSKSVLRPKVGLKNAMAAVVLHFFPVSIHYLQCIHCLLHYHKIVTLNKAIINYLPKCTYHLLYKNYGMLFKFNVFIWSFTCLIINIKKRPVAPPIVSYNSRLMSFLLIALLPINNYNVQSKYLWVSWNSSPAHSGL